MQPAEQTSFWRSLPLLLASYVLALLALSALTVTVAEPTYELLLYLAVTAGFLTSAWGLYSGRQYALPSALIMGVAFLYYALRFYPLPGASFIYAPEVAGDDDTMLAGMVAWLLIAFSFLQSRRSNLIFLAVSGLALCGLMGTKNLNVEMRVIFSFYVVCALFCWGYEQFLEMDDRLAASGQRRMRNWPEMVRGQLSVAVLVGVLTVALGSAVGTGAYKISPNLYERMSRRAYGQNFPQRVQTIFNSMADQFDVGTGTIHLSPIPVMRVAATRGALWRGMVYDTYNGRGWSQEQSTRYRTDAVNGQYVVPQWALGGMAAWTENRQTVELLGYPGRIVSAAQPALITLDVRGQYLAQVMAPTVDVHGCVEGPENELGRRYSVVSYEPVSDPERLRRAPVQYPRRVWDGYLGVPPEAGEALSGLVKEITQGAVTPYDKVVALERYLEERCLYTLAPPAVPKGRDAASYFVLESRRGACDLFATSLAVMSRLAQIPARVATGYATGEYDAGQEHFVVRGTDAHAWVEVYFPGYGWVSFDPQAAERYEEQTWTELLTEGHWDLALKRSARQFGWLALLGVLAFLAVTALVDPMQSLRGLVQPRGRSPLERLSREYQGFYEALLRRLSLRPEPWLTPEEAIQRIAAKLGTRSRLDSRRLAEFNARFYRLRYDVRPRWSEVEELRQELRDLRRRLKRRR